MRDVGKGPAVHERGGALERLHQVRLERVLEQGRHSPFRMQVVRGHGLVFVGVAHHDAAQALLEVGNAGGQAEDGHYLAGHGDVEAVFARHAMRLAAQAVHHMAQLAVVHVHHALPGDAPRVDAQVVVVVDPCIEQRRKKVVGRPDGVEVAREVKVDVLHGNDLRIAAAGRAALHAEHGAQRRLAQGEHGVPADLAHAVGQAHAGGGLALARGRGVDGGHQDELAGSMLFLAQQVVIDFRLVLAIGFQVLFRNADLLRYLGDGQRLRRLRDLDVRQHTLAFLVGEM